MSKAAEWAQDKPEVAKHVFINADQATFEDAECLAKTDNPYCGYLAVSYLFGLMRKRPELRQEYDAWAFSIQEKTVDRLLATNDEQDLTLAGIVATGTASLTEKVALKSYELCLQRGKLEDFCEALEAAKYLPNPMKRQEEVLQRGYEVLRTSSDGNERVAAGMFAAELAKMRKQV